MKFYTPENPPTRGTAKVIWDAMAAQGFKLIELHYNPNVWGRSPYQGGGSWAWAESHHSMGFCGLKDGQVYVTGLDVMTPNFVIGRDERIPLKRLSDGLYRADVLGRRLTICRDDDDVWFIVEDGARNIYHKDQIPTLRLCRKILADMQSRPEKYWPPDCAFESPEGKALQGRLIRTESPERGPTQYVVEYFSPQGRIIATVGQIWPIT